MLTKHQPKGPNPTKFFATVLGAAMLLTHIAFADTVYRCGNAYSTSNQCGHTAATEVKPSSVFNNSGQEKSNAPNRDLREAQALETQRLHAQRQALQAAPTQVNALSAPPVDFSSNDALTQPNKPRGKHARKPPSPYFTAVDPNAAPKKKSTAKAVPARPASSQ
ncbi:hypothetical protein [Limnohabitans sp.]|uniref:hypothetical protein n=1 Tax=Limnohabitans sp. TaxID=1907725 RepID=UPI00286EEB1E|nr:hypothetical protein [Limnohabitans sp.]